MNDIALLLNPNLSGDQVLALMARRAEHAEKLIDEMVATVKESPEIAEPYLRSLADMPLLPIDVRTFASAALGAVQAANQYRKAKADLAAMRERHARENAEIEAMLAVRTPAQEVDRG